MAYSLTISPKDLPTFTDFEVFESRLIWESISGIISSVFNAIDGIVGFVFDVFRCVKKPSEIGEPKKRASKPRWPRQTPALMRSPIG